MIIISFGTWLLIITNSMFLRIGKGTASPFSPPKNLENPMTTGILLVILGESIVLGSNILFFWFLFYLVDDNVTLIFWEEPLLVKRFGEDYILYNKNVPRWIRRLRPWNVLSKNEKKTPFKKLRSALI